MLCYLFELIIYKFDIVKKLKKITEKKLINYIS